MIIEKKSEYFTLNIDAAPSVKTSVVCTARVYGFLKPTINVKANKDVIEKIESVVCGIVEHAVSSNDVLSDRHIVDFTCTKEHLKVDKWSRWEVNFYLLSNPSNNEKTVVDVVETVCFEIGNSVVSLSSENGFRLSLDGVSL